MTEKQAEEEIRYRLAKFLLFRLQEENHLAPEESEKARQVLCRKYKPFTYSQEERSMWHILIPEVVVEPDGTLIFHIIDGAQIPYIMQQTSPLRRKPLRPEEREAYRNGVPSSVLAERYECSPVTIRAIARRTQKASY